MSTATKSAPKKVAAPKKVEEVVVAAAATPVAETPKRVKKAAATTPVEATVETPAVTAQPVATDAVPVEEVSWQVELKLVQEQLVAVRDAAATALAATKRLEKRALREIKDARKNRRRQRAALAEGEERKPSIFQVPVPVTDELSVFLGGSKNNLMSRSQVTKAVSAYIKENGLNDKHKINPNPALRKLLGVKEGDELTIFNMQSYLQKHYVKNAPPTA
jgi:hypothetical protein